MVARTAMVKLKNLNLMIIVLAASICFPPASAWAHGVVGDYMFLEPLVAEDPTPANELDIVSPGWARGSEGQTYSIGTEIEKVLWKDKEGLSRFSMGGGTSWSYLSPNDDPSDNGFDNLEVFAKYAFLIVPRHELLLSIALSMTLPTGNPSIEEQQHTSIGPSINWEKALGDLPNWPVLKFLRPVGFQGNFGYETALGGRVNNGIEANQVIEYSLPYLSNNVQDIGLPWPLRNLFPYVEFNYSQAIRGPSGETFPQLLVTPGIAYVGYQFELSVGTQLALNNAAIPENHAVVLGLLDIFYDSVLPEANWTLNDLFQ